VYHNGITCKLMYFIHDCLIPLVGLLYFSSDLTILAVSQFIYGGENDLFYVFFIVLPTLFQLLRTCTDSFDSVFHVCNAASSPQFC
jgi:hypothetical protein